ncbi:MAG: hypothetical protein SF162_11395 [bacterium]|nr:hypothetical protein [bacterium]
MPEPSTNAPEGERENALRDTLVHRLLLFSERQAQLSPAAVAASLALNALVVAGLWWSGGTLADGIAAGGLVALLSATNAVMLAQLPVRGRSWGNPKPPLLALSALQALLIGIVGVFAPLVPGALVIAAGIGAGLTALAFYATWIEPFNVGVTRQRLVNADSTSDRMFTLLHLSDLHIERVGLRERRVNALIEALKPDMIVFSGDFINISYRDDPTAHAAVRDVIGQWHAPYGVYVVPGTPAVENGQAIAIFTADQPNLTVLLNEWRSIDTPAGTIHLLGLVTTHDLAYDRVVLAHALNAAPKTPAMRIVLTHSPDLAPDASKAGCHLYLCGHTHGGQIRVPFIGAILTASHYGRRFVMGRYNVEGMTLYTTRGLGMEGFGAPRARFLCPPEVVLWEIKP